jgi:hypothetical protein
MDVAAWLQDLGLERYEPAFRANDIDARELPSLTAEDCGMTTPQSKTRSAALPDTRSM